MTVILITGANRGLGLGFIHQCLLRPQYSLVIGAARTRRENDELSRLEAEFGGRLKNIRIDDMGDFDHIADGVQQIEQIAKQGINVLINNALHIYQPYRTPENTGITSLDISTLAGVKDYRRSLEVNTLGPLHLSVALYEKGLLKPNTDKTLGTQGDASVLPKIVNIGSAQQSLSYASEIWHGGSDRHEAFFHPIYAASKNALSGVTVHLSRAMKGKVLVNSLHPGRVATDSGRFGVTRTADEAASAALDVIESWKMADDSGQFVDWRGRTVPW